MYCFCYKKIVYLEGDTFYFPVHRRKWGRGSTASSYTNMYMLKVKHLFILIQTYIVIHTQLLYVISETYIFGQLSEKINCVC